MLQIVCKNYSRQKPKASYRFLAHQNFSYNAGRCYRVSVLKAVL